MINLTINNSTCKIEGLDIKLHETLLKLLSYPVENVTKYAIKGYKPRMRTLLGRRGDFPTGLLYIVTRLLRENNLNHTVKDLRSVPTALEGFPRLNLPYMPYIEQEAAAEAARTFRRGIICAPTGTGKSLIIALIINALKVKTLIVVPTLELKDQLTVTLKEIFGPLDVGSLPYDKLLTVANIDSLSIKNNKKYDCVIIDEFHHSASKTYRKLNKLCWNNTYYKFGLTATPFRSQDNEHLLLESVLSKVIYRVKYEDAVRNKRIVPLEAYYVDVPKTKAIKGDPFSWPAMYKELVVENEVRNELIRTLIFNLEVQRIRVLTLVKEISHGKNLGGDFANGEDKLSKHLIKEFNQGNIISLVGTTGVLGEGVDTKPCEYVIIAGLGKSRNALMQQIGRGFRNYPGKESCKVILFKDGSHKWTRDHFRTQCKIIEEEYGIKVVKL